MESDGNPEETLRKPDGNQWKPYGIRWKHDGNPWGPRAERTPGPSGHASVGSTVRASIYEPYGNLRTLTESYGIPMESDGNPMGSVGNADRQTEALRPGGRVGRKTKGDQTSLETLEAQRCDQTPHEALEARQREQTPFLNMTTYEDDDDSSAHLLKHVTTNYNLKTPIAVSVVRVCACEPNSSATHRRCKEFGLPKQQAHMRQFSGTA